jgi:hypothetical protein
MSEEERIDLQENENEDDVEVEGHRRRLSEEPTEQDDEGDDVEAHRRR